MIPTPDLLDAWEADGLTDRHVRGALAELDRCVANDALRGPVIDRVLTRCRDRAAQGADWPTPGGLRRMIRAAALLMDPQGAQERQDAKTDDRGTQTYPLPDGQAALSLEGPAEQILIAAKGLRAQAKALARRPGETRTLAQLEFDLAVALLSGQDTPDTLDLPDTVDTSTGEIVPAPRPPRPPRPGSAVTIEVQVLIPFDTLTSTSTESSAAEKGSGRLGELVGYGPITPANCQDLLSRATTIRRVITDPSTGRVMVVDDPIPGPARTATQPGAVARLDLHRVLEHLRTAPVTLRDLSTDAYRPTRRAVKHVQTRDQPCRFPGCTRPATDADLDHQRPWPHGPTSPENLHPLCRHHHRAKQSGLFTVQTDPDGSTRWTLPNGTSRRTPPPDLTPDL